MSYFVYIVECADGTYYTGSTNDIEKRITAHNTAKAGAKYTRGRRPVKLVYAEMCLGKNQALQREAAIKQMSRTAKRAFVEERKSTK